MNPAVIVVITEVLQLPFEISGTPEGNVIQQLSTHASDHALDERMRWWHMRYDLPAPSIIGPILRGVLSTTPDD